MRHILAVLSALILAVLSLPETVQADGFSACQTQLPFGIPKLKSPSHTMAICHQAYAALVDDDALVPRWVAYRLTAEHALGCLGRTNDFHADIDLPAGHRALPADYVHSGYDQGHQAPADDFAWEIGAMKDSFSLANMAPQLPGLNRAEWERLEETVRVWAWARGDLIVYVGPVLKSHPKMIGSDHVQVPAAFWKVVVDATTGNALAFEMPQKAIKKGDLGPWETTIRAIEKTAGIELPLPANARTDEELALWPADLSGWKAAKKKKCD
jgi:endonuclease G